MAQISGFWASITCVAAPDSVLAPGFRLAQPQSSGDIQTAYQLMEDFSVHHVPSLKYIQLIYFKMFLVGRRWRVRGGVGRTR